ncbi:MAG: RNA-directed DNA polymerase (Reverse transcriptase) [Candidatus Magasanikbacteria bacterium GW2011_GWA2_56_11]|uniref:RNA-directed DNA polymerase (Reverse transcriptase) n=1 Tax=Candidatus Magasanikbacteria bacterium GW2011_GWA2_56_11 TaxID=1619044 RepID=A0A0G2BBD9_9BACT|nr:MAG: RNA-directed DNA polymerase (Reverse transcriptase) [Candidatus Magasanikbacteria bacterium GW2011_GWA2_56_11]
MSTFPSSIISSNIIYGNIIIFATPMILDWLGDVLLPRYRVIRAKTKHRMFAKVRRKTDEFNRGIGDDYRLDQTVQSYLGILGHCQGYKIEEELKNEVWINKAH